MNRLISCFAGLLMVTGAAFAAEAVTIETSDGCSFDIKLRADIAPQHVERISKLASDGFYNGIVFHRVIEGFMAQTGDPTGTGMGGSELPDLPAEFSKEHFARGTVGMARSQNPNSGNSQFFIMFAEGGFLDGQYTVFGQVDEDGMKCVDQIERGEPPTTPDKIVKVSLK